MHSLGEERGVKLSMYEEDGKVSYAERAKQFFLTGSATIKKCRDLLQSPLESSTKTSVKKNLKFLTDRQEGQKDTLGKMQQALIHEMKELGTECRLYAEKICKLKNELDESLGK